MIHLIFSLRHEDTKKLRFANNYKIIIFDKTTVMTVTIKKTDSIEEMNRKIEKVMRAGSKTKAKKTWDINKYFGKIKGVYGDGLEYQKKMRDEWER